MNRAPVMLLITCCVALLCSCNSMKKGQRSRSAVKDSAAIVETKTVTESRKDSTGTKSTDSTSVTITAELPSGGEIEFMPESDDTVKQQPTKVKLGPGAKITYNRKKIIIQENSNVQHNDSTSTESKAATTVHEEEKTVQKDKQREGSVPWLGLAILGGLMFLTWYSYKKWRT